jgi:hypothetical protein
MDELTPGVGATGIDDLVLHKRDGMEEKLADEGESGGVARWKAVFSDGGEEFSEDMIDVGGGEEFARGGFGKQRAKCFGLEELAFCAGVEDTESGMILAAQHAAFAAIGELKLAEMRMIGGGAFFGHGSSFEEVMKQGSKDLRKSGRG